MSAELRHDREAFLRRLEGGGEDESPAKADEDTLVWKYLNHNGIASNSIDLKDIDESSYSLLKQWSKADISNAPTTSKEEEEDVDSSSKSRQNHPTILKPVFTPLRKSTDDVEEERNEQEMKHDMTDFSNQKESLLDDDDKNETEEILATSVATLDKNTQQDEQLKRDKQNITTSDFTTSNQEIDEPLTHKHNSKEENTNQGRKNEEIPTVRSLYEQLYQNIPDDREEESDSIPVTTTARKENKNDKKNNNWSELVLEKLQENQRQMNRMEQKIDVLAKLVLALSENSTHKQQIHKPDEGYMMPSQPVTVATDQPTVLRDNIPQQQQQQQPQQQPQQVQNGPIILSLMEKLIQKLLSVPQIIWHKLQHSFPVRLIVYCKRQNNGEVQLQMDWFFFFKMILMCTVLSNKHADHPLRVMFLITIAIVSYFFRLGLIPFLHRILIKEGGLKRVWNHEENNDDSIPPPNQENNDEAPQRRGARDRVIAANPNDDIPNPAGQEANEEEEEGRNRQNVVRQNPNFVIRGNIHPRRVREGFLESVVDIMMDILYFFGSFILSLLPMWRPEPVLENINNNEENNDEPPQNHPHED